MSWRQQTNINIGFVSLSGPLSPINAIERVGVASVSLNIENRKGAQWDTCLHRSLVLARDDLLSFFLPVKREREGWWRRERRRGQPLAHTFFPPQLNTLGEMQPVLLKEPGKLHNLLSSYYRAQGKGVQGLVGNVLKVKECEGTDILPESEGWTMPLVLWVLGQNVLVLSLPAAEYTLLIVSWSQKKTVFLDTSFLDKSMLMKSQQHSGWWYRVLR